MEQFPGDPNIADKVIKAMLSTESIDSEIYAKISQLDHQTVMDCLQLLESCYPNHFQGTKPSNGYGNGINLFIRPTSVPFIKNHQQQGGFSGKSEMLSRQKQEDKERESLEMEKLRMEVQLIRDQALGGSKRAEKRAHRSEIIAWLAIVLAAAAILIDILKN